MTDPIPGQPHAIREERPGDEAGIRRVHESAFPSDVEARLVDLLRQSGRLSISLVALIGEQIVGHVAFSPVTVSECGRGLGLAPVAVVRSFQRRGIGAELILSGIAACRQQGAGFVVVLGEPAYYGRFGFLPAARWRLSDEYGGGEAFQAMELTPEAIPSGGELVRYAPEFSMF